MITTAVISYIAGVLFSAGLYIMHPKYARLRRDVGDGVMPYTVVMQVCLFAGIGYGLIIFIIARIFE